MVSMKDFPNHKLNIVFCKCISGVTPPNPIYGECNVNSITFVDFDGDTHQLKTTNEGKSRVFLSNNTLYFNLQYFNHTLLS